MLSPHQSKLQRNSKLRIILLSIAAFLVFVGPTETLQGKSAVGSGPPQARSGAITAYPNPILVTDGSGLGITHLSWTSTGTSQVQVRVGSPAGALFASTGPNGASSTGKWVGHGTVFYLQDISGGLPLTQENTLATITVNLTDQRWNVNGNDINNTNSGNVGVGTSTPTARLEVIGPGTYVAKFRRTDNSNGGILIESPTGFNPNVALATGGSVKWYLLSNNSNSDVLQFWDSSGAVPRFTLTQNGNLGIGIGVGTPLAKLHVSGVAPWGTAVFSGTSISSHFNYNENNSEDTYIRGGKSTSHVIISDVNAGNVLVALGGGNVGIATATPTAKLHVQGNGRVTGDLTVDGNIAAKYQDVAEWVPAEEQLPAGTVVVLDETKPNHVTSSNTSYDTRVAGVISQQPGIVLGEKSDTKVLVATTGRVKVKVDATNGPIQIGDLLVTSDREGFAMKSMPVQIGGARIHRPGTLIGKALERLAGGTGEILVLLSLQ